MPHGRKNWTSFFKHSEDFLALDSSRRHLVVSADDVQLLTLWITRQPRRRFHEVDVRLRSPPLPFVGLVNQAAKLAQTDKNFRYHSSTWLENHARRRETMKFTEQISRRFKTPITAFRPGGFRSRLVR